MRAPNGIWRSCGYGWLLRIDNAGYELSHVTRANRVVAERGSRAEFERAFEVVSSTHQRLSLHQADDLTRYDFDRLDAMPALPAFAAGVEADALINFDTLWQTFAEHYAFFDLHHADWNESRRSIRPRVTSGMPADELVEIFADLLRPLDDGHVRVDAGGRHLQALKAPELRRAFRAAFGTPTARISPRSTVDAVAPKLDETLLRGFPRRTPLKRGGNDLISWCELERGVGYLSVLRLFGFADSAPARRADDLPQGRVDVARFLRDDLAALEAILDEAMGDLAGCRAIVVDLRINGGGFDRAGLAIASRLADASRVAFTKKARDGAGFTGSQEILVPRCAPDSPRVAQSAVSRGSSGATRDDCQVAVLLSPLCVSAGEICALGLRASPRVKTFGQPTAGMLSDNLHKRLPNGWAFSLSNEVYTSHDGQVFEGRGIPPDRLLALDPAQFVESMRAQLGEAVARLSS